MNIKKKLVVATALVLASSMAQAVIITANTDDTGTTIPLTTTNWDTGTPPPAPMELPFFDASLGDLNSVTLEFRGDASFDYKIENISPVSSSTGTNKLIVNMSFTPAPCGTCVTAVAVDSGVLNIDLSTFDGAIDFLPTSGVDFGTIGGSVTEVANVIAANIDNYKGVGNFEIDSTADSDSDRNISGGDLLEQTTWQAGAWASVTYDYTEVPEPTTLVLIGSALLLGGVARRRRS